MERSQKIRLAKWATVLSVVPALLWAYSSGPDPFKTGAPGDTTCSQSGCHIGTAVNANGNKISITFEGGTIYTPGEKQRVTVAISEPAPIYGFQMSARLASNRQAGNFTPGTAQAVLCQDGSVRRSASCPSSAPLEFIEHTQPSSTPSFSFDWTAPSAGAGDITFYVAVNAANANGQADRGDKIYTANATLTPAATGGGGPKPAISQGGVSDAFNGQSGSASATWTAIYGTNLSSTTRDWSSAPDFAQGRLPTSLDGVSVTINNKPAPVFFISPGQINILAPADNATGDVAVVVTNPNGASNSMTVRKTAVLPSIYAPFGQGGSLFATVVENSTGAILGKPGVEPRAARAVRPGDVVQLYTSGLGATNPTVPTDRVVTTPGTVANPVTVRIGGVAAQVFGAALTLPGLYQVNIQVPQVSDGDQPIVVEVSGAQSPGNVFLAVKK